jgi:hypothetical protein
VKDRECGPGAALREQAPAAVRAPHRPVSELLPSITYLHGLAQGNFEQALRGLLGEGASVSSWFTKLLAVSAVVLIRPNYLQR